MYWENKGNAIFDESGLYIALANDLDDAEAIVEAYNYGYPASNKPTNQPTIWQYYKAQAIAGLAAYGGHIQFSDLIADAEAIADAAVAGDKQREEV